MFDGLMDYKTIINLLPGNNKALKEENERLKVTIHLRDEEIKQLKGEKVKQQCGNCDHWAYGIKTCRNPRNEIWYRASKSICPWWTKKKE